MKYIFEDNRLDLISKFFMSAYSEDTASKFIYANGNSQLINVSENALKDGSTAVVYIDTIPGNKDIYRIYRELSVISRRNNYRLIVLPIVCSEYYLIKSLLNTQVIMSTKGIKQCINKEEHWKSNIIETVKDREYAKNFEKVCKLILMKNFKDCALHCGKTTCARYGKYYLEDCICNMGDSCCNTESQISKVTRFLAEYPCVPINSHVERHKLLSVDELWNIHRELVREYNQNVTSIVNNNKNNINFQQNKYKTIREIH